MTNGTHDWSDHLDPGETVLWEGAPTRQLFLFRPIDALLIPSLLVWMSFPILLIAVGPIDIFILVPIAMLLFGLQPLLGRFVYDAWRRRHTTYALTERRALIQRNHRRRKIQEQVLQKSLALSVRGNGRGSVSFGTAPGFAAYGSVFSIWTNEDRRFTFRGIDNPMVPYGIARATIQAL